MVPKPVAQAVEEAIFKARLRRQLPPPEEQRRPREQAGVSRRDEATWLGVTESTVWRWENGDRRPGADLLDAYADLLDLYRRRAAG